MKTKKQKKLPYIIARCHDAGVHAGEFVSRKGREVVLRNSRRLWFWRGAASLSELAVYGAKNVSECKFGVKQDRTELLDCCEILYVQPAAEKMIRECPEWRA